MTAPRPHLCAPHHKAPGAEICLQWGNVHPLRRQLPKRSGGMAVFGDWLPEVIGALRHPCCGIRGSAACAIGAKLACGACRIEFFNRHRRLRSLTLGCPRARCVGRRSLQQLRVQGRRKRAMTHKKAARWLLEARLLSSHRSRRGKAPCPK
jgi:hypothetical protein